MPRLARFYRWLTTPPQTLPFDQPRTFSAASVAYPLATGVHLLYFGFFALAHVQVLALVNALSVVIWIGMSALVRQSKLPRSFYYGIVELALSVAITVSGVGWGFGVQYFLMAATIFTFLVEVLNGVFSRFDELVKAHTALHLRIGIRPRRRRRHRQAAFSLRPVGR